MIGQTISHYKVVEKLGEGGMGAVYRAEDLKLGRTVALKFVLSTLGGGFSGQERLMREAKACAALNHPNITTIYDFGEADSVGFIVMEFVDGRTLQDALADGPLEPPKVIAIGIQIADALEVAHAKGIIHRDLKAANIMLDGSGRVKVMDFGLAKFSESSFVTQMGTTLGTAAYMSPEQVRSEELTPQSDIYSLGVVLYELATGGPPFAHAHHLAVMYAVANEDPVPPRERNPMIPAALEAVILKAMAKDASRRYATCGELSAALRAAAAGTNAQTAPGAVTAAGARMVPADGDQSTSATTVQSAFAAGASAISRAMPGPVTQAGSADATPFTAGAETATQTKMEPRASVTRLRAVRDHRWFRIGVPVIAVALVVSLGLLIGGPALLDGLVDGSPKLTASVHYDRGFALWEEARYSEARSEMQRAVEVDPSLSNAWSVLAAVSAQLGEFDRALQESEMALEVDTANTDAYYNLAYAAEELGDYARAQDALEAALRHDPSFTAAYSALGNLLIKLDRPQDAVSVLLRAVEATPDSEHLFLIHKNLGKAYIAMGRFEDAAGQLTTSTRLQPDWPETAALLAEAYQAVGRTEQADAMWQRFTELESDPEKIEAARARFAAH